MAKTYYTRKLGKSVALRNNTGRYHVISGNAQKWAVVSEGEVRPIKVFATLRAAVDFAKRNASKLTGEVLIHEKTGQIRDTISFAS